MDWRTLLSRCMAFFDKKKLDDDLDEELESHIAFAIEENLKRGLSKEDARSKALREFGGVTQVKETYRIQRGLPFLDILAQDVRFAARQARRAPGFAVIAILTLALGIGANTAVFTLMHALLLSSLPVRDPGQLVRITMDLSATYPDGNDAPLNLPVIQSIERRSHSFHGVFAWCIYDFVLKEGDSMHGIHGAIVSGNAFQVLGVRPAAGRLLNPADDQPGGGPDGLAAVISHRIWVEKYHADPSVVGKHITVTDHGVTIVGVAPAGFEGVLVAEHPDIYLPLEFQAALYGEASLHNGRGLWLTAFARLKPGVRRAHAAAEVATMFPSILDETLPPPMRHIPAVEKARIEVKPARTGWSKLRQQYTEPLLLLQLLVVAVLLICCANLSGLFLARASTRQQEFAIRGALGAGRLRLMRQLFVECLILALPGALLGIELAWLAGPLILHLLGNAQAEASLSARPDMTVLAVTAICALLCALLFGMAPAWTASHTNVEAALRNSHPRTAAGNAGARSFFVPFQVALSLTLVVVATLLGATVVRLRTENPGYRIENVIFVLTDFNRIPQKGVDLVALYRRMVARMAELPGVEDASVAAIPPLLGWSNSEDYIAAENAQHGQPIEAKTNDITARYFSAVGTPILSGRDLQNEDADQDSCIVNQTAARFYFPNSSALGKTLRRISRNFATGVSTVSNCEIVGIVQDTKYDSLRESPPPIVYRPITKDTGALTFLFFVIHARSITAAKAAYLKTLHELAPASPEIDPFLFTEQFSNSIAREQLLSILSGFFALLALLLSGIGIYGLVAWSVTRRTTEIGVRMALGATRAKVFVLVMRQVAGLLATGVLIGGLASFFAARSIRSFLFEIQPENSAIFALSALLLVLVGLLAAILPARRAVAIDPMQALRTE